MSLTLPVAYPGRNKSGSVQIQNKRTLVTRKILTTNKRRANRKCDLWREDQKRAGTGNKSAFQVTQHSECHCTRSNTSQLVCFRLREVCLEVRPLFAVIEFC